MITGTFAQSYPCQREHCYSLQQLQESGVLHVPISLELCFNIIGTKKGISVTLFFTPDSRKQGLGKSTGWINRAVKCL